MAMVGGEGSFIDVRVVYSNFMVVDSKVKLSENNRAMLIIEEPTNNGYMIFICKGNFIELPIVEAKHHFFIRRVGDKKG